MENKFERASHYIQMTRLYIRVNDLETAWKFAVKIYRLFPITESRQFLKKLQQMRENCEQGKRQKMANVVQNVKNSKNYYTMLGINCNATVPEIKKAYRKLVLLLHPDKNVAPDSGEVFSVVKKGVDTLCDCKSRNTYDRSLNLKSTFRFTSTLCDCKRRNVYDRSLNLESTFRFPMYRCNQREFKYY